MIRTGQQYRDSIRDGRMVWVNGERVRDVTTHRCSSRSSISARASTTCSTRPRTAPVMSYQDDAGELHAVGIKLPYTQEDWQAKRAATDTVLDEIGGIVTRVGDETVGEMWSLFDGQDVLNEVNPQFSENIRRHIDTVIRDDPFHVSANTDPKGDRSKRPQDQDPDMLLHVVKETDAGIIVRGAKYETAAAYANQAFTKPTIANWGDAELSDYAVGFICDLGSPNLKFICRTGFAGRAPVEDYPLVQPVRRGRHAVDLRQCADPVGECAVLPAHQGGQFHPRHAAPLFSAFAFVQRNLKLADFMIGAALFNARQTGLDKQQAVQEKLAQLACYREGINAHLTAAIATAERSPGGLLMPNQSLLYDGPRSGLLATASDDAYRPRAVRRADLRDAGCRRLPRPGDGPLAGKILHHQRRMAWPMTGAACWPLRGIC